MEKHDIQCITGRAGRFVVIKEQSMFVSMDEEVLCFDAFKYYGLFSRHFQLQSEQNASYGILRILLTQTFNEGKQEVIEGMRGGHSI